MGGCNSSSRILASEDYEAVSILDLFFGRYISIPIEVVLSHFTPSSFPLIPMINKNSTKLCQDTWAHILNNDYIDDSGVSTSGMTMFYNSFYERLDLLDTSGRFEAVLCRNATGGNKIAAKGVIIIRMMKFVLEIQEDNLQTKKMLNTLGKSHIKKLIRPWQYAIFVQTILLTISYRLGMRATSEVMTAWVHLFAYVLKHMLPPAIAHSVDPKEFNINTSDYGNIQASKDLIKQAERQRTSEESSKLSFLNRLSARSTSSEVIPDDITSKRHGF
mmetsp:Transcript_24602/g.24838  ORF Transcript_24602/g.24838 Transcript_24602/m.24838 type:complete len:274 (+) Transcript_24602:281-1102(+)